jgi:glycosyltransferase involved in cell wall biosynthesis
LGKGAPAERVNGRAKKEFVMLKKLFQKRLLCAVFSYFRRLPKTLVYLRTLRKASVQPQTMVHWMTGAEDEALFRSALQHPQFSTYEHFCIVADPVVRRQWRAQFKALGAKVHILSPHAFAAYKALAKAAVILSTKPLETFYSKRAGQRLLYVLQQPSTAMPTWAEKSEHYRMCLLADGLLPRSEAALVASLEVYPLGASLQAKLISGGLSAVDVNAFPQAAQTPHFFFYTDSLRSNGITVSLLNLLNLLVHEGYEVTFMTEQTQAEDIRPFLAQLPARLHFLSRKPAMTLTPIEWIKQQCFKRLGETSRVGRWSKDARWWREEVQRYVGLTPFSSAVEFDGYSAGGAMLMLEAKTSRHLVWAHADMESEHRLKHPRLKALFSLYPYFDAFVSCSEALCQVNKAAFDHPGITFKGCKNVVNTARVLEGIASSKTIVEDGRTWLLARANQHGEIKRVALDLQRPDGTIVKPEHRFLMVGRLSVEKNYAETLRAFAKYLAQGHQALLLIVGDGPLRGALEQLIVELKLEAFVTLVGWLYNPAELMQQADCFLLTSLHEGQPMVINEARIVGLPIILSQFGSYADVALPNGQYLVGMSADEILKGFEAFASGASRAYTYDATTYNQSVLKTFLSLALDTNKTL